MGLQKCDGSSRFLFYPPQLLVVQYMLIGLGGRMDEVNSAEGQLDRFQEGEG